MTKNPDQHANLLSSTDAGLRSGIQTPAEASRFRVTKPRGSAHGEQESPRRAAPVMTGKPLRFVVRRWSDGAVLDTFTEDELATAGTEKVWHEAALWAYLAILHDRTPRAEACEDATPHDWRDRSAP